MVLQTVAGHRIGEDAEDLKAWMSGLSGCPAVTHTLQTACGSDNSTVPKLLGWERAETLAEAIAMGRSHMGRSAQITMLHHPPILITDVR